MVTLTQSSLTINQMVFRGQPLRLLAMHADFVCGRTGACCADSWRIPVQFHERDRLTEASIRSGVAPIDAAACFAPSMDRPDDEAHFATSPAGGCVYLERSETGASCRAQRLFGHALLPAACQSFPRIAVRTPAGVYLTLSCACPTAARGLLAPDGLREVPVGRVNEFQPEFVGLVFGDRTEPPAWSVGCRPSWAIFDGFWRWAATRWMTRPDLSPAEAILGLDWIAGEAVPRGKRMLEADYVAEFLEDALAIDPGTVCATIGDRAASIPWRNAQWERLLRLIDRFGSVPRLFQPLLASFESPWADLDGDRARPTPASEIESLERAYLASRLHANPLLYRAPTIPSACRAAIRFWIAYSSARAMLNAEPIDSHDAAAAGLRAAGVVDRMLLHQSAMHARLLEALDQEFNANHG